MVGLSFVLSLGDTFLEHHTYREDDVEEGGIKIKK
jgi:hypothetical protein